MQNFAPCGLRTDVGALWENFIICERVKFNHYRGSYAKIYFWRTTSQQKIDYIEEDDGVFKAFEIKWNAKKSAAKIPEIFSKTYSVKEFKVVTPENYLEIIM
ncbi:MAG: DUF4143 domain-containing protein [Bacteroidales bacterium]|nr:DUF4143 domain-containing protein [Bacteroidales bacterium]